MGGIAGFIDKRDAKAKSGIIEEMSERIVHRGPGCADFYVNDTVAIVSRNIEASGSSGDKRLICNADKTKLIFFDGDVYNSSPEEILHGFEEQGCDILGNLRGTFAFVIWDSVKNEMFAARDHFGAKPFYYALFNDAFIFGSEIKSFIPHPDFKYELNGLALKPYLTFQCSVLNETFFKNVYKLDAGHYLTYSGSVQTAKYHEYRFCPEEKSIDEYCREIRETVRKSVDCRRPEGKATGAFLSGGIDSSYITAMLLPDVTFSVGFDHKTFNETGYAKELADILKIRNTSKIITPDEFFGKIEDVQYYLDEPSANLSAVPLFFLSEMAGMEAGAVFSGEGADELFGGYNMYKLSKLDKIYRIIPKFIRYPVAKLAELAPRFYGRNFLILNGLPVEDIYVGQAFIFNERDKKKVLNQRFWNGPSYKEISRPYFMQVAGKDDVTKMQYLDMHLWLPHDILLKADKMAMAHSLDVRAPFLDQVVFDLARKLPEGLKVNGDVTKYALRVSAGEVIPEEWGKRPKLGFPVPVSDWLREEKYYNLVKAEFKGEHTGDFFNKKELIKLLDSHYDGRKNNARKIWTIYAFLLWYKVYFLERR